MKDISRNFNNRRGFSLVELVMVIVVISILVALMLPAFGAIQKMALNMRQRAQFTTIEAGLEAFQKDFGYYPPSNYSNAVGYNYYCGAQKLAEAMVGLDGHGCHKDTVWRPDGYDDATTPNLLYDVNGTWDYSLPAVQTNLASRKGPYLEADSANAVYLNDMTFPATSSARGWYANFMSNRTMILADQFGTTKNNNTNKKSGMPILYYRAGSYIGNLGDGLYKEYIYDYRDNFRMAEFTEDGDSHPWLLPYFGTGSFYEVFYPEIQDTNYSAYTPHRTESYILISAGLDGNYGTADDVYNFDTGE